MEIKVAFSLPMEAVSIPVVRHICTQSLRVLGVRSDCVDDVEVAVSEACANVLLHALEDDSYEVSAGVDDGVAVIEVVDTGGGFDHSAAARGPVSDVSEYGRGIQIMRALMDNVQFSDPDGPRPGTRVRLSKRLAWDDGAPLERLAGAART